MFEWSGQVDKRGPRSVTANTRALLWRVGDRIDALWCHHWQMETTAQGNYVLSNSHSGRGAANGPRREQDHSVKGLKVVAPMIMTTMSRLVPFEGA
jgi:hypothetical protein